MQVQEAQKVPNKMDAKRPTSKHIIIKMPKIKGKERLLKASREKQLVTRQLPDWRRENDTIFSLFLWLSFRVGNLP